MFFLDDNNAASLLELGIDMTALPSDIQNIIKDCVREEAGIDDLNLLDLEMWHLRRKGDVLDLERDILKPLQRKTREVNDEIIEVESKISALDE